MNHRLHAMDHLRAHMMLLGIIFHAALAFTLGSPAPDSPYRAESGSGIYGFLVEFIHLFRMPVFFVVAGFFTSLLISRRGVTSMINNRFQRIALPLVIFWLPLFYLSQVGFDYSTHLMDGGSLTNWAWPNFSKVIINANLIHLWFLYVLLAFYVIAIIVQRVLESPTLNKSNQKVWNRATPIFLGFLAVPAFWINQDYHIPAPLSFTPDLAMNLFYAAFFVSGMSLYMAKEKLTFLAEKTWLWGVLFIVFYLTHAATGLVILSEEQLKNFRPNGYSSLFKAMAISALVLFVISAYLRWANNASKLSSFLSESSYWLYLIHFPFTVWLPPLMHESPIPIWARFLMTIAITVGFGLLSYILVVRKTLLGQLLNGTKPGKPPTKKVEEYSLMEAPITGR